MYTDIFRINLINYIRNLIIIVILTILLQKCIIGIRINMKTKCKYVISVIILRLMVPDPLLSNPTDNTDSTYSLRGPLGGGDSEIDVFQTPSAPFVPIQPSPDIVLSPDIVPSPDITPKPKANRIIYG